MGFNVPRATQAMSDAVMEGSSDFNHLALLNLHSHRIVHGPLAFQCHRNVTVTAGIKSAFFGSAAVHHNQ